MVTKINEQGDDDDDDDDSEKTYIQGTGTEFVLEASMESTSRS